MFEWDEEKRKSNLIKHSLDFKEAGLVYFSETKETYFSIRNDEYRDYDVDFVEEKGGILLLVYKKTGDIVRVISFRFASKKERKVYENAKLERLGKS